MRISKFGILPLVVIPLDTNDPNKIKQLKKEYEKYRLLPTYLDQAITDMTRLVIRFGNLTKRFVDWEEKEKWLKKARKLNPGVKNE